MAFDSDSYLFLFCHAIECIGILLGLKDNLKLINQPENYGKTALHFAAAAREKKILIEQLLSRSTSAAYLRTLLLKAASSGDVSVLKEILRKCPNTIQLCDLAGKNALHLAMLNNTELNVKAFLSLPRIMELVNEPDNEGNTQLHLETMNHKYKLVKKLISTKVKGVDLRAKNQNDKTALDICES